MSRAEETRRRRIAIEHALADKRRRLDNCRYYVQASAPGGAAESENANRQWRVAEADLLAEIADLEAQHAKL